MSRRYSDERDTHTDAGHSMRRHSASCCKAGRSVAEHRPWPRAVVDADTWTLAAECLTQGSITLLGLWGETEAVHLALLDEPGAAIGVLSLPCPDGQFPSVAELHAPAIRLERTIQDLFGLEAVGLPDARPWLDHGRWGFRHPLGNAERISVGAPPYPFLPVEGEHLHRIPVGPVHAGIIEPGHFRFTASGETIVRLEARLGYVHKGVEGLMAGADLARGAELAGRVSGDSTVAYAFAFARAARGGIAGRGAAPRTVAARADGGTRAPRQPFRRHRCDLQRRRVLAPARALRRAARAGAACGRPLLRTSTDARRHRPGRRRARPRSGRRCGHHRDSSPRRDAAFRSWSTCTTTRRRCRTAPSAPAS